MNSRRCSLLGGSPNVIIDCTYCKYIRLYFLSICTFPRSGVSLSASVEVVFFIRLWSHSNQIPWSFFRPLQPVCCTCHCWDASLLVYMLLDYVIFYIIIYCYRTVTSSNHIVIWSYCYQTVTFSKDGFFTCCIKHLPWEWSFIFRLLLIPPSLSQSGSLTYVYCFLPGIFWELFWFQLSLSKTKSQLSSLKPLTVEWYFRTYFSILFLLNQELADIFCKGPSCSLKCVPSKKHCES